MGDRRTCQARQHSDQRVCHACGLVWDINDPDPPTCQRGVKKLAPGERQELPRSLPVWLAERMAIVYEATKDSPNATPADAMAAAYRVYLEAL